MSRFTRAQSIGLIVSALAIVGGIVTVFVTSLRGTASFGWFAYQPLANSIFYPGNMIILTGPMLFGVVVAGLGLLGLAFLIGLRRGAKGTGARS